MVYMLAAVIVSAVKSGSEGGASRKIMLFSLIITYGGKSARSCACTVSLKLF